MLIVRKGKLPAIIAGGIVAALLIFAAAATGMPDTRTASAQSTPPGNVTVRNSSNAGEAVVTWEQASGAQGYRIGWVNYQAVLQAVEDGIPWTERFAYTDVRSSVDSHAIPNLMGGEQYAFLLEPAWASPPTTGQTGSSILCQRRRSARTALPSIRQRRRPHRRQATRAQSPPLFSAI